jgi:hypothetical protein
VFVAATVKKAVLAKDPSLFFNVCIRRYGAEMSGR